MTPYYKLTPITEKPDRDGRYSMCNSNGDAYFSNVFEKGAWKFAQVASHYLKPLESLPGMRWVKASESPVKSHNYHVKIYSKHYKYVYNGTNYYDNGWSRLSKGDEVIEWLDESTSQPDHEKAISFAEWITKNNYVSQSLPHELEQIWEVIDIDDDFKLIESPQYTTTQLYALFDKTYQPKAIDVLVKGLEEIIHHIHTWSDEPERAARLCLKVATETLEQYKQSQI